MRRSLALTAAVLTTLGAAAPAAATPPVQTRSTLTSPLMEIPILTSLCGLTILGSSTVSFHTIAFTDEQGTLTHRITHGAIDGVLVRASTGAQLTTRARWTETFDLVNRIGTISGVRFSVQAAHEPPREVTVGHLVAGAGGALNPEHSTPRFEFPFLTTELCEAFPEL
jgi:malonyl CoA-acyl carrier protein transacylase